VEKPLFSWPTDGVFTVTGRVILEIGGSKICTELFYENTSFQARKFLHRSIKFSAENALKLACKQCTVEDYWKIW
jgi:hypothetical protein